MKMKAQLTESDTNWLINQLESIKDTLTSDISNYSKGFVNRIVSSKKIRLGIYLQIQSQNVVKLPSSL